MSSFSNDKSSRERRHEDYKAERAEKERTVVCKGLHYLHQTEKAVLVQEGEDLAGENWRKDGREVWLPKARVRTEPSLNRYLERGDPLEKVELPKWLADEKELMYD
jgi:hypothetical protein